MDNKDKSWSELLDTPEKVEKLIAWVFDDEVDQQLLAGIEVSFKDYKKE